jgi:hypothetical protein
VKEGVGLTEWEYWDFGVTGHLFRAYSRLHALAHKTAVFLLKAPT